MSDDRPSAPSTSAFAADAAVTTSRPAAAAAAVATGGAPPRRHRRHRGRRRPDGPPHGGAAGERDGQALRAVRQTQQDGRHDDRQTQQGDRQTLRDNHQTREGSPPRHDGREMRGNGRGDLRRGDRENRRHEREARHDGRGQPHPSAPAPALPPKAVLDTSKPAAAPLTAAEQAELKQHFAFIAKYRRDLRLRANDAEDLLINGAREPTDRGVCMHLLGKIDRALVNATLARVPDPARRTRILAGVVRFSRDAAILILYLESLSQSASRDEAATTLVAALPDIDYSVVSAAQMRRVLELIATLLPEGERPVLVLSLLRSSSFRAAFDLAAEALPEALASLFAPMRAVFAAAFASERSRDAVVGGGGGGGDDDDDGRKAPASRENLARGVRLLLAGQASHLARLPEETRARLVAAALELGPLEAALDRASADLLGTLPKDSRRFSQLATQRARQLLAADRDADAVPLLEELRQHHPDFKLPGRWLAALGAPKIGRLALLEAGADGRAPGGMQRGLWLTHQRQAWVVIGGAAEAQHFLEAAAVHAELALPGLLPLLTSGVADDGTPYVAVLMHGEPLPEALSRMRHEPTRIADCLRSGVELVAALALAGVALPDAELERFTLDREERLHLGDLTGARKLDPGAATTEALPIARALCEALLRYTGSTSALRRGTAAALSGPSLQAVARALALM